VLDGLIISNSCTNVDDQQTLARIPCDQRAPTPAGSLPRDHAHIGRSLLLTNSAVVTSASLVLMNMRRSDAGGP
jgi:hypothetical protein